MHIMLSKQILQTVIALTFVLPSLSVSGQPPSIEYAYSRVIGNFEGMPIGANALAVSPVTGHVYVSAPGTEKIQVYTSSQTFVTSFGGWGATPGKFKVANGIAIDNSGNYLFITDKLNHRIQVFNKDGGYIRTFGSFGNGPGQFIEPAGIALDAVNNIYVVDQGNSRVQIFDVFGNFITAFGSYGSANGQFRKPSRIATTSSKIYVADTENHRVQVFDLSGTFLTKFGNLGNQPNDLSYPNGIAVDSYGNIFVADDGNNRVSIFNSNGVNFRIIPNDFSYETDLKIDPSSNIYTATNDAVRIFNHLGDDIARIGPAWPDAPPTADGRLSDVTGVAVDNFGNVVVSTFENEVHFFNSSGVWFRRVNNRADDIEVSNGQIFMSHWGAGITIRNHEGVYVRSVPTRAYVTGMDVDALGNVYYSGNTFVEKVPPGEVIAVGPYTRIEDVAVDNAGNRYIVDSDLHEVHRYSASGYLQKSFGSYGPGDGQFISPSSITVDQDKAIYVSDWSKSDVQVFNDAGNILFRMGGRGKHPGTFDRPRDLAVDNNKNLYVADYYRVQVFSRVTPVTIDNFSDLTLDEFASLESGASLNATSNSSARILYAKIADESTTGDIVIEGNVVRGTKKGVVKLRAYVPETDSYGSAVKDITVVVKHVPGHNRSNSDQNKATLSLYPNPTSDKLFLTGSTSSDKVRVEIRSLSGEVKVDHELSYEGEGLYVDVSHLMPGVYMAIVSDGKAEVRSRIVKR